MVGVATMKTQIDEDDCRLATNDFFAGGFLAKRREYYQHEQ